eukprot:6217316-Amphidinium_carterae.1
MASLSLPVGASPRQTGRAFKCPCGVCPKSSQGQRGSWHPGQAGWHTTRGYVLWCQASATGAQDSQAWTLKQVAERKPDFAGLEAGLDPVDLQQWRKLSNKATHAGRAACSAAAG